MKDTALMNHGDDPLSPTKKGEITVDDTAILQRRGT